MLITVLAAMVLLALVAARLDARIDALRSTNDLWGRWQAAERDMAAARDELLFAMATRQLTPQGFGAGSTLLRVDDRLYGMASGVVVQVQDMRGLIAVAFPELPVMRSFLLLQGVTDRDVDGLLDKLADYNDRDDLRRLNGAEAEDYRRAGMAPPRNDWPLSAHELRGVLGWQERPALLQAAVANMTAVRDGFININTAPPAVLRALPGATQEGVANLLLVRNERHLGSAAELQAVAGIVVPDDPISFYPGEFYRLTLHRPGVGMALQYTVMLTPGAPLLPWQVLEVRQVAAPQGDAGARSTRSGASPDDRDSSIDRRDTRHPVDSLPRDIAREFTPFPLAADATLASVHGNSPGDRP